MDMVFTLVREYGVMVIFAAIMLEYACFPLPSEVLLPLAGVLCARCGINWSVIYGLSILAGLIGSTLCYSVGRLGGAALLGAVMHRFPRSRAGIEKGQAFFARYDKRAVCLSRLVPICRTYISFIAGAGGQRWGGFAAYSALGIAVWNAMLLSAGYILGDDWPQIVLYYQRFQYGLFILLAAAAFIWLARRYKCRRAER